jgi:hypothetical protein
MSIQTAGILAYVVDEYVQQRYVKHWYYEMLSAPMFARPECRSGRHLLTRAIPRRTT